jgi:hypothetical protein
MNYTRRLLTLLVGLVVGLSATSAAAAASTSGGTLTTVEFQQMQSMLTGLAEAQTTTASEQRAAKATCNTVTNASSLLREERALCLGTVNTAITEDKLQTVEKRCATYKTVSKRFNCVRPDYARFDTAFAAYYKAELSAEKIARARGFGGKCVVVLSQSAKVVSATGRMAHALNQILAALRTENLISFESWSGKFITYAAVVQAGSRPATAGSLALCPHQ